MEDSALEHPGKSELAGMESEKSFKEAPFFFKTIAILAVFFNPQFKIVQQRNQSGVSEMRQNIIIVASVSESLTS